MSTDRQPVLLSPEEVIAPGVGDARLLTRSARRRAASAADLAPPAPRPGSAAHAQRPSRMGDFLYYRDGRVTDLSGRAVKRRTS